jgi:translation initiation factor 1
MGKNSKNKPFGVVFSTNPDFDYITDGDGAQETLPPAEQNLRVHIEKKGRKGKPVSIVTGFVGSDDDLADLARILKTKCGVGGSAKEGDIILQGTMRDKVVAVLLKLGYGAR